MIYEFILGEGLDLLDLSLLPVEQVLVHSDLAPEPLVFLTKVIVLLRDLDEH